MKYNFVYTNTKKKRENYPITTSSNTTHLPLKAASLLTLHLNSAL